VIDLEPDDEQRLVIETVQQFAREELRPRAREAEEARKLPAELLERAHALGLVAAALPEAYGGGGSRSARTQVLIAEELAWGDLALAVAILSPALLGFPLADFGTEAQRAAHLPTLSGARFAPGALALAEPRLDSDPLRPRTRARTEAGGWVLEGSKCLVPWLEGLEHVAVSAAAEDGAGVFLVATGAPGLRVEPARYMGLCALPLVQLELAGVRVAASQRLGGEAGADLGRIVAHGRVAAGALGVGLARAAFELARDYARTRETFGAPIATRQSIAFMLADMATEIDALRLLVWEAAWRIDRALEVTREAALLSQQTRRVVLQAADGAVQIWGGHGYVRANLPELLLRNAAGFASFDALALV
jgi:alkylation response protein AidB-like acyl-CoA dehydrogenase